MEVKCVKCNEVSVYTKCICPGEKEIVGMKLCSGWCNFRCKCGSDTCMEGQLWLDSYNQKYATLLKQMEAKEQEEKLRIQMAYIEEKRKEKIQWMTNCANIFIDAKLTPKCGHDWQYLMEKCEGCEEYIRYEFAFIKILECLKMPDVDVAFNTVVEELRNIHYLLPNVHIIN